MIKSKDLYDLLVKNDIHYFAGVPDSLLKHFCAYLAAVDQKNHTIAANEGGAVGLAIGHYLSTGKPACVYLQNSGLGNIINPLLSLADKEVYGIPILFLFGWRGEPGIKDEPQHIKQGKVMTNMLGAMDIPFQIIDSSSKDEIQSIVQSASKYMREQHCPYALLAKKNTFDTFDYSQEQIKSLYGLTREDAIRYIIELTNGDEVFVSTTGMTSRELFELRKTINKGDKIATDFLTVGGMGHANQIAAAIAKNTKKRVICIDGDGALLMHLGGISIIPTLNLSNFVHVVINNGAHDSVGGQPTVAQKINLGTIAKACGYDHIYSIEGKDIHSQLDSAMKNNGLTFLEILVDRGHRKTLGRPTRSPLENKHSFMEHILNDNT